RNFTNSAFPSTTFNFGPMVATVPHFDTANLSFGWCSITALGSFDSTRGGHIIAWALGLVIRFPSGATIDLPSAIFEHSNVTIQEGETRASFTQYAAGGLFRYVANGLQTDKQLSATNPALKQRLEEERPRRWEQGLGMFSTMKELLGK
ncbi:hypothetical protein BD410DRAFT_734976, partial [Rickenella mellea]